MCWETSGSESIAERCKPAPGRILYGDDEPGVSRSLFVSERTVRARKHCHVPFAFIAFPLRLMRATATCRYYLSLPTWLPMRPPTAAPPTVPIALPPVSTAPPTAPTPAPIAVLLSRADIDSQPPRPSSTTAAIVLTANLFIVFTVIPIFQTSVKKPRPLHCRASNSLLRLPSCNSIEIRNETRIRRMITRPCAR